MSEWMSVKDAAGKLGLDESTVYRLCRSRKIQHRKIGTGGGRIVFTQSDIDGYLEACVIPVGDREAPAPPPARLKYLRPQGSRRA